MQNTKSNEQQVLEDLAHISKLSLSIEKKREDLSMIEFGMLKSIQATNPDFDFHEKIGAITQDSSEKKELSSYLNDVMPVPNGYKQPASNLNATDMQSRIFAATKYLANGKKVSDDKTAYIAASRVEMTELDNALTDRGDNYAKGNYDKTMINPAEIQATIDAGGNPFKKTESLVLFYDIGSKDDEVTAFAVNRTTGNQGEYPSYNFPNANKVGISVVKGNPFDAENTHTVVIVSGDLRNHAVNPDTQNNPDADNSLATHKKAFTVDNYEAAALAWGDNMNGRKGEGKAMIVADVRSLTPAIEIMKKTNPNAKYIVYTDLQTDLLKETRFDGSVRTIESAAMQAIELSKINSRSEAEIKNNALWVKPIPDSLTAVFGKLKDRASDKYPDNEYQAKEHYRDSKSRVIELVEEKGKEHTDRLRASYVGNNAENTEDLSRKAERDSRLNARINPSARNSVIEDTRPVVESIRETIAPTAPENARIAPSMP